MGDDIGDPSSIVVAQPVDPVSITQSYKPIKIEGLALAQFGVSFEIQGFLFFQVEKPHDAFHLRYARS
jgi:hypothetical protein